MAYEKTNWVDNETPINAANLNKMEDGIVEASKTGGVLDGTIVEWEEEEIPEGYEEVEEIDVIGSIISATISGTYTIQATNTKEQLTLDPILGQVGNGLTKKNGKIIIGKGINYIKVSGQLMFEKAQSGNVHEIRIYKNNTSNLLAVYILSGYINGSYNTFVTATPIIAPVTEGDNIILYVTGVAGDKISGNTVGTHLTVEAVG